MSDEYINPSGLARYDANIKEVINSKEKTLTQAEYSLLSDEEKNNGTTYYISDVTVIGESVIDDSTTSVKAVGAIYKNGILFTGGSSSSGESYDDTALSNRVTAIEEDYLTSADKTELTDTISNVLPLSGGTMDENASIIIPSTYGSAWISVDDEAVATNITADSIYIVDKSTQTGTMLEASGVDTPSLTVSGKEVATKEELGDYLHLSGGTMNTDARIILVDENLNSAFMVTSSDNTVTASVNIEAIEMDNNNQQRAAITPFDIVVYDNNTQLGSTIYSDRVESPKFVGNLTGTASKATALANTTAIGSSTKPVYINASGSPTACTYSLNTTVPSSAVFTDTKNTAGSTNSTSKLFLVGATTQATNPQTYSNSSCYVLDGQVYSNGHKCITSGGNGDTAINIENDTDQLWLTSDSLGFLHYDKDFDIEVCSRFTYDALILNDREALSTAEYRYGGLETLAPYYDIYIQDKASCFTMGHNCFYGWAKDGTKIDLGLPGSPWKQLYAATSTIATSDRNEKTEIAELDDNLTKDFVMSLKPSSYKFINNDSNRTHYGMISQDVEEAMNNLGMSSLDFAGFIKSPKMVTSEETGKLVEVEGEYAYGLRYEEFIAPMIKMIQMQQKEIEELKTIVADLSVK